MVNTTGGFMLNTLIKDEAVALLRRTPGLRLPTDLLLYAKTLSYVFSLGAELDDPIPLGDDVVDDRRAQVEALVADAAAAATAEKRFSARAGLAGAVAETRSGQDVGPQPAAFVVPQPVEPGEA